MDGDDSSSGRNRLSDVAPTPQGTKGEEEGAGVVSLDDLPRLTVRKTPRTASPPADLAASAKLPNFVL